MRRHLFALLCALACASFTVPSFSATPAFKKVMIVIFENTNYSDAMNQPFFAKLATQGALLTNFYAETHPSQPNYIALTSGDMQDVDSDDNATVDVTHIGNLLEAKGKSWKVYAEGYPGNCYLGRRRGTYVRKHEPFASYRNVQKDPTRCANIVSADALQTDLWGNGLPDYSLYIPDLNDDGHDTGVSYANDWFEKTFSPLLQSAQFRKDLLLVATFDESGPFGGNHIYTALWGDSVVPGAHSDVSYDHYSILRTIEDTFGLGTLGRNDSSATPISGVWKDAAR